MIRSLMASTALLALVTTGALAQQQPADQTQQMQQPEAQQPADQQMQQQPAQQPGAADQAVRQTQEPGEILVEDLIGETIYSARTEDAESIGDINDLLLDADGNITAVVIGIGGFLGIGQRDVAIDFEQLEFTQDEDGELMVVVNATREELEAAPEFEATDETRMWGGLTDDERQTARVPQREAQPQDQQLAEQPEQQQQDQMAQQPQDQQLTEQPEQQPQDQQLAEQPDQQDQLAMAEPRTDVEWIDENQVRITIAMSRSDFEQAPGFQADMAEAPADQQQLEQQETAEQPEAQQQDQLAEQPDAMMDERIQVEQIGEDEVHIIVTLDRNELGFDFAQEPAVAEAPAEPADQQVAEEQRDPAAAPDQQQMTETAEPRETRFLDQAQLDDLRATHWLEAEVVNEQGEDLGQVSDLLLQETGDAQALLIDVGGFLGIGQREVAIPVEQVQVEQVDEDQIRIIVAMTQEELEQAPEFDRETAMAERQPQMAEREAEPGVAEQQPGTEPGVAEERPVERQAARAPGVAPGVTGLSADELMGADVIGADNENIGNVGDVIFGQDGRIRAVVVDVGGFLGLGARNVAVEFESIQLQREQDGSLTLFVNATQEQLEQAPEWQEQAALQDGQQPAGQEPAAQQPAEQQPDQQQPAQQ
jgi:sporulation protein YlmC with PRC-barrel domain